MTDLPARFLRKAERKGDCLIWTSTSLKANGYGIAWSRGRTTTAHHAAWEAVHGVKAPVGLDVRHSCDNRLCIEPRHLSLGTRADNMADARRRGRRTGRLPRATQEQIDDLKQRVSSGSSVRSAALAVGLKEQTARDLLSKRYTYAGLRL